MSQKQSSGKVHVLVAASVLFMVFGALLAVGGSIGSHRMRAKARQTVCLNQLKMIGVAMELYSADWGDRRLPLCTTDQRAPDGKGWPDLLMPYMKKIEPDADRESLINRFRCPDSTRDRLNYSLNRRTAGWEVARIKCPSVTIAVFDSVSDSTENNNLNGDSFWRPSDGGVPPVGSLVIWPGRQPFWGPKLPKWARPRHRSATEILFADGHIGSVSLSSPPEPPEYAPRFDPAKPAMN